MENKIQQLTEKLYEEGLSKGKAEAEAIVAKAKEEAAAILAEADKRAAERAEDAERRSAEIVRRGESELKMAASQVMAATKSALSEMVLAKVPGAQVREAFGDDSFVRSLMSDAVKNFGGGKVVVSPENESKAADYLASAVDKAAGEFTVKGGDGIGRGFRIEPKGEGYYISFDEKDFDGLVKSYLREALGKILFEEK
ncbi:MAG: hypothetical protein K2L01_00690 [Rikenellaceae bacterium]|nr:hypothetical protein [Rikenellaceae bacterium]